jgi:hypothetical protein
MRQCFDICVVGHLVYHLLRCITDATRCWLVFKNSLSIKDLAWYRSFVTSTCLPKRLLTCYPKPACLRNWGAVCYYIYGQKLFCAVPNLKLCQGQSEHCVLQLGYDLATTWLRLGSTPARKGAASVVEQYIIISEY